MPIPHIYFLFIQSVEKTPLRERPFDIAVLGSRNGETDPHVIDVFILSHLSFLGKFVAIDRV
jgi:hypothetical protein